MLERIIFLFCSLSPGFALGGLLRENRERLRAEWGIAYPDTPQRGLPGLFSHDAIVAAWGERPALSEPDLHAVLRDMQTPVTPRTLIIKASSPHTPAVSCLLRATFKKLYPRAVQYAVLVFSRQDTQLELSTAGLMMRHACDVTARIQAHQKQYPLEYGRSVQRMINAFGSDGLLGIVYDDSEKALFQVQRQVLRLAGVPALSVEGMLKAAPSPRFLHQPRPFLYFCQAHIALNNGVQHRSAFPWAWEALRITSHSPWPEKFCSLLGPEMRDAVLSAYASSNAEMAHLLGLGHLFSDPDPEPDWEPWPGLTEEAAFTVAQRLEPGFARALMAEFDAVPTHDMAREQRLCRDALHDALDPPCSAPPVRRKTDAPKLSVLTLTYNHAAYIAECMESVIAQQTAAPIRHIIADDASDDGTRDIVLDYAARYPHIVPVLQRQRSFGLRALFDMARTEYVALCEGDDYFTDPEKLRIQTEFLDAHQDCALCFHPVRVVYEDEPDKERVYPPPDALPRGVRPFYYLGDLLKHNFIQTNSVMYRWRFRNGLPSWFRTDLVPGDWYWHLLHAETGKIGFINTTMSVYRRHKQALYYLADKDRIRHRATVAMRELEVYDVLNKHFGGKYEASLLPLADGVFSACLLHGRRTADKQGKELLDRLCEAYPDFAAHYLRSLERTRHD